MERLWKKLVLELHPKFTHIFFLSFLILLLAAFKFCTNRWMKSIKYFLCVHNLPFQFLAMVAGLNILFLASDMSLSFKFSFQCPFQDTCSICSLYITQNECNNFFFCINELAIQTSIKIQFLLRSLFGFRAKLLKNWTQIALILFLCVRVVVSVSKCHIFF